jgi:inorganic pyrophosphatase
VTGPAFGFFEKESFTPLLYADIAHLGDLNRSLLKQIDAFFVNYQKAGDVSFTILAHAGPERALEALREATSKKDT